MKTIITTRRFERWTRRLLGWLSTQFAAISNPIEVKIYEVKSDVANVEGQVANMAQALNRLPQQTDLPTDYAKEETAQGILTALGSLAKQGSDNTATNTAIKQLILNEGIEHAHEYAVEINEIIGDWNNE